jgi:anthranilate synthase component 1
MQSPFDIAGDLDTPVSAYLKLSAFRPCFLLESVEGGARIGRYSFIGFGETRSVSLSADGFQIGAARGPRPATLPELLGGLRKGLQEAPQPVAPGADIPLAGGLVGFSSYDLVRYFERLPAARHAQTFPDLHYVAPQSLLVFDHVTRGIALLHAGTESERQSLRREIIAALRSGIAVSSRVARYAPPTPSMTRDQFLKGVARTQEHIAAGDIYQLVLSVQFSGRHELDPFQVYRALRRINPSPYLFYCNIGGVVVIGSSPEALVKLDNGIAELRPIAGTRPRSADPAEDVRRETELLADPKESAEHVMLVDLARNDLGRVAAAGSVHVDPYRAIERYSHVMHIVSGVRGKLAPGRDAFDLFAAAFPAGTLVGAPKVRAMEIIDELEPVGRGLYGGTVGYFGKNGSMDKAITIRSLVLRGDEYSFQAGAGIVANSVAESEHDEVLAKSAAMARALEMAKAGV